MLTIRYAIIWSLLGLLITAIPNKLMTTVQAQQSQVATDTGSLVAPGTSEPLNDEELAILVARIALYPDELVALISAASLYPLQLVEADRYLRNLQVKPELKPKSDWDGSVISLLNYPEIVKMMSEDLDWTQALADALVNQQQDVLIAIQQLRERALAQGVIKTDDKVEVQKEEGNIVIRPASTEVIYVPQYQPQMLYDPTFVAAPITYYPTAYPYYYSPAAPFFAGFVTGLTFAAVVDWNDWGVWGGRWGNDINIDCNNCFNNREFNGKINFNDVDWRNVDRNRINFDKTQLGKIDRNEFKNSLKSNDRNSLQTKAQTRDRARATNRAAKTGRSVKDVRASTLEGLKTKPRDRKARARQKAGDKTAKRSRKAAGAKAKKRSSSNQATRRASKPKAAAKRDRRPRKSSPVGKVSHGKKAQRHSKRGARSMGGGAKRSRQASRGGRHKQIQRRGGRRGGGGQGRRRR